MNYIIIFAIPFVITLIIKYFILKSIEPKLSVYEAPTGMGFIFAVSSIGTFIIGFLMGSIPMDSILVYVIGIFGMGFIGLINDMFNQRHPSFHKTGGFRGVLKGSLQTAVIKAFLVVFMGVLICLTFTTALPLFLINLCIIVGFTNLINVLDAGAGRAIKSFILFYLLIVVIGSIRYEACASLVMLGAVIGYASSDLKARVFMGDIGANILGVWLGITALYVLPVSYKIVLAVLLVILNVIFEMIDIDKIIKGNTILRAVDKWGR